MSELVTITVDTWTYQEIIKLMERAEKNREASRNRYRQKQQSEGYRPNQPFRFFKVEPVNPMLTPLTSIYTSTPHNTGPIIEII